MSKFFNLYRLLDKERHIIKKLVDVPGVPSGQVRVLDVGCGYGRNLIWLISSGFDAMGVDANRQAVLANREQGLNCITLEEISSLERGSFDVILMSHIIEHFLPEDLVMMMDGYLDLLRSGGKLVIATPLPTSYFFEDFTHVRPYTPESLLMVYGEDEAQVGLRSKYRLSMKDIWFRRSPWKIRNTSACYRQRSFLNYRTWVDAVFTLFFLGSGGLLGRKDGWVGVFEKR